MSWFEQCGFVAMTFIHCDRCNNSRWHENNAGKCRRCGCQISISFCRCQMTVERLEDRSYSTSTMCGICHDVDKLSCDWDAYDHTLGQMWYRYAVELWMILLRIKCLDGRCVKHTHLSYRLNDDGTTTANHDGVTYTMDYGNFKIPRV